MGLQIFDERVTEIGTINILAANTTVAVASSNSTGVSRRYDAVIVENTDTIDHTVEVIITANALDCVLGQVNVPTLAGTLAVPAVDLAAALAPASFGAFILANGSTFKLRVLVAVTSTFHVRALCIGGQIT